MIQILYLELVIQDLELYTMALELLAFDLIRLIIALFWLYSVICFVLIWLFTFVMYLWYSSYF